MQVKMQGHGVTCVAHMFAVHANDLAQEALSP